MWLDFSTRVWREPTRRRDSLQIGGVKKGMSKHHHLVTVATVVAAASVGFLVGRASERAPASADLVRVALGGSRR